MRNALVTVGVDAEAMERVRECPGHQLTLPDGPVAYNEPVAHVADGECRGAKGGTALASYAPAYHEREWLAPFLSGHTTKLHACNTRACPCRSTAAPSAAKRPRASGGNGT